MATSTIKNTVNLVNFTVPANGSVTVTMGVGSEYGGLLIMRAPGGSYYYAAIVSGYGASSVRNHVVELHANSAVSITFDDSLKGFIITNSAAVDWTAGIIFLFGSVASITQS